MTVKTKSRPSNAAKSVPPAHHEAAVEPQPGLPPAGGTPLPEAVRHCDVLIVDDSPSVRRVMKGTLRAVGHEVHEAPNGEEGLRRARERLPDVVLCDINMPVLDGLGFVQAARADPVLRTVPILMVTAEGERKSMRRAMEAGADDFIPKPFTPTELVEAVNAQLARRRRHDEESEQRLDDLRMAVMSTVPHELRTPLSTVLGYSELLLTRADRLSPAKQRMMLQSVNDAAQQLSRTVSRLMAWAELHMQASQAVQSQPQHGQAQTDMEALSFWLDEPGFREQILAVLPHDLRGLPSTDRLLAGRQFRFHMQHGRVACDTEALQQMLIELIGNAVRFSIPGSPVVVNGQADRTHYLIEISNHGPALPLQVQRMASSALVQHDRQLREQQGCGLGLALASLRAQREGGSLQWLRTDGNPNTVRLKFMLVV